MGWGEANLRPPVVHRQGSKRSCVPPAGLGRNGVAAMKSKWGAMRIHGKRLLIARKSTQVGIRSSTGEKPNAYRPGS
jgi:hypothetical protein